MGMKLKRVRTLKPTPAIALCGAFNLNRRGSPGDRILKAVSLGRQKFTSSRSGRLERKRYHSKSVLAIQARIF